MGNDDYKPKVELPEYKPLTTEKELIDYFSSELVKDIGKRMEKKGVKFDPVECKKLILKGEIGDIGLHSLLGIDEDQSENKREIDYNKFPKLKPLFPESPIFGTPEYIHFEQEVKDRSEGGNPMDYKEYMERNQQMRDAVFERRYQERSNETEKELRTLLDEIEEIHQG